MIQFRMGMTEKKPQEIHYFFECSGEGISHNELMFMKKFTGKIDEIMEKLAEDITDCEMTICVSKEER